MYGKKCPNCHFQAVQLIDVISEDEDLMIWHGQCLNCGHETEYSTKLEKEDNCPEGEFE